MKTINIYHHILQGHEASKQNAIDNAQSIDWQSIETTKDTIPKHSTYINTINGIDIYYNYGADYYFFSDSECSK